MSKLLCSLCLLFLFSATAFSQKIVTTKRTPKSTVQRDTLSHWTKKNQIGFDISEIAFLNWNAGGTSSISGLLKTKFTRIYTKENYNWTNELVMRYGLNKQDGIELRKTEDAFQYNTAFGYRTDTISNWYYTAKLNFNTQFTEGYSYPNTSTAVSKLFAPAYLFVGMGAEYATKEKNKLLSSIINVFVSESSKDKGDNFRNSDTKEVIRDKTKSVFNFVWKNTQAGLLSAMAGDGEKDD